MPDHNSMELLLPDYPFPDMQYLDKKCMYRVMRMMDTQPHPHNASYAHDLKQRDALCLPGRAKDYILDTLNNNTKNRNRTGLHEKVRRYGSRKETIKASFYQPALPE